MRRTLSPCCARAAGGRIADEAAKLPSRAMKSRRRVRDL